MFSQYGEPRPTNGWRVWSTLANFNGFRVFDSLLHRRCSTEVNQTLRDVWPFPGLVHYIYTFGGSCPLTEFYQEQNSLCVQVFFAFSYIDSVKRYCTALEQCASVKLCGVGQGRKLRNFFCLFGSPIFGRAVIALGIGPQSISYILRYYLTSYLCVCRVMCYSSLL